MRIPPHLLAYGAGALSVAASLSIALDTLWGQAGWPRHQALAAEVAAIEAENAELSETLRAITREIAAQEARPEVQEALVRDLLGYVRPHDLIVTVDTQAP
jgi:cell division protein FtsB